MMISPAQITQFASGRHAVFNSNRFSAPVIPDYFSPQFSGVNTPPWNLDYTTVDPTLTPEETKIYQECERQWHQLIEGLRPDEDGVNTLIERAEAQGFKIYQNNLTDKYLKNSNVSGIQFSNKRVAIKSGLKPHYKFYILAHELMHALHCRHKQTKFGITFKSIKNGDALSIIINKILKFKDVTTQEISNYLGHDNKGMEERMHFLKSKLRSEVIAYATGLELAKQFQSKNSIKTFTAYTNAYHQALTVCNSINKR